MAEERIGLRAEFEAASFEKEVQAYNRALGMAYEGTAKYSEQMTAMAQTGEQADAAMGRMAQQMQAQGASYQQIVAATGQAAASQLTYAVDTEKAAAAQAALKGETATATEEVKAQSAATEGASVSTTKLLNNIVKWGLGIRSIYVLYRTLRKELGEAFKELYGGTEAYKALTASIDNFWRSIITSLASGKTVEESLQGLANFVNEFSRMIRTASATISALNMFTKAIYSGMGPVVAMTAYNKVLTGRLEEQEIQLQKAAQGGEEYQKAIEGIVGISRNWDNEMAQHAERIQAINDAWGQAQVTALGDLFGEMHQIATNEQAKISDVNTDALADRGKAFEDYNRRVAQTQKQAADEERKNAEQHALEMEFAARRHSLQMTQNERVYQASRNRLVAEGDVLAIEELDERTALERQTQEENYALQMQQAEAMYQLQARYQAEANRQQVESLRLALDEQLREIETRRREQVDEAKAAADEERAQAGMKYAGQLTDAKAAQMEQLSEEQKGHDERIAALGEMLAEYGRKNKLGLDEVQAIWESYYGPDSQIDTALSTAFARYRGYVDRFTLGVETAMTRTAAAVAAIRFTLPAELTGGMMLPGILRGTAGGGGRRGRQYGGEDIVSSPTPFMAGERGAERVTVQPLSTIGNAAMSLSWQGGPIPVQGQGNLEGADLSGIGDQLTIAIMSRIRTEVARYGRRGA